MRNLSNEFKNKKLDYNKLINYGFKKNKDVYIYEETLNDFKIIVNLKNELESYSKLIELDTMEEFLLVDIDNSSGRFVSSIKEIYQNKINDIINKCTKVSFNNNQTSIVIEYIKNKYNEDLEFLWEKYPGDGVFRHKESGKWYAVILNIQMNKLGLNSDDIVDIIDLKINPEELDEIVDNKKYFRGYHMNKRRWVTIILNDSISNEELFKYIDKSYNIK